MGEFRIGSFILGLIVGALLGLTAAVLYPVRDAVQKWRRSAEEKAAGAGRYITGKGEMRYRQELGKLCRRAHIAGDIVPLDEILVEPRFLVMPDPPDPTADGRPTDVMDVIPRIFDMPASYSPYNLETLAVHELGAGDPYLVLIGPPGAGKSTALAAIALYSLGELRFKTLEDVAQEFEAGRQPDESMAEAERHALEQLRLAEEEEEGERRQIVDLTGLTPVLVHVADIMPESIGGKVDPAEPLVQAVQRQIGPVAAATVPRFLYRQLSAGNVLLLLDGYDEVPDRIRARTLTWLGAFIEFYGHNRIIAVGPVNGYGGLADLGFVPIFLRAWSDSEYGDLVGKWASAWPRIIGSPKKPGPPPDEKLVQRASTGNRGHTPLDVTLKVWAAFAGDQRETGRRGWYDAYIRRLVPIDEGVKALRQVAVAVLEGDGFAVERKALKTIVDEALKSEEGRAALRADEFLPDLVRRYKLLTTHPGGLLSFRHQMLAAFLASEAVIDSGPLEIARYASDDNWAEAMTFAAAKAPMDQAVAQKMGAMPDLLVTNLFQMARWLSDSPSNAPWRREIFKRLAYLLLTPSQYLELRERAMAALVASRDPNVLFIFRQALRSPDPKLRRLGCVGMGALGLAEATRDLAEMLNDGDPGVQRAAGLALGAIGTEKAMETMIHGLVGGDEGLRRAIAEALAALPGEGHEILQEAIEEEDMMTRRAAVFGLRRVRAPWALALIYKTMLDDEQWYVRSAAQQAFAEARKPYTLMPVGQPPADQLGWLVAWAAERGEGVPPGDAANEVLIRVLQEGEPPYRIAAAVALARLGHVPAVKPLYGSLRDKDPEVRDTAFRSLAELQLRMGTPLPGVL